MSMKKTDLEKRLAKKLDGRMKAGAVPQRFGQGSAAAGAKAAPKSPSDATRLVPVACRLPAGLVRQLRERAAGVEGGMNVVMARAVASWLGSPTSADASTEA